VQHDEQTWRVVRAERGAVLVVPSDDTRAEPLRVALARDGLAPSDEGRAVPAVGDEVLLDDSGLARVLPRRSTLVRDSAGRSSLTQVLAANVDVVLVVEHLDPEPDLGRVERMLTLAWRSGAKPVVVLTKADLVAEAGLLAAEVAGVAIGVDVHTVSVPAHLGLEPLRELLAPGVTFVLVGPSGAGKSTLVNALAGREVAATGERRADGRGRHTTTHRELVRLDGGALLIDTPGIRSVGLVADAEALERTFADVAELAGRCRFADCSHTSEPGCAVQAALASGELPERRYTSWRKLEREAAFQGRRADARLRAEERARWKQIAQQRRREGRAPRP
jgi:ribosome biogenesis GTPase